MKQILKDDKAFHPVISGVVLIAVIGIIFGILVMVYGSVSTSILPTTFDRYAENFNTTDKDCNANNCTNHVLTYTLGLNEAGTPYSLGVSNDSVSAFISGIDYNVTVSNNTIRIANRGGSGLSNNKTFTVTYDYQTDGTASVRKIDTNTYKGFDLGSIAPIVLAAGLIISIVVGFGVMMFRRD